MRFLTLFFLTIMAWSSEDISMFAGRVVRIHQGAKTIRIRTTDDRVKYLNSNDRVQIWNKDYPDRKCTTRVINKTTAYLLLKVPDLKRCMRKNFFTTGVVLQIDGIDLKRNLKIGKELRSVLKKKQLASMAKKVRAEKQLARVSELKLSLQERYDILREKLEQEYQKELALIEEDRVNSVELLTNSNKELNDISFKLMRYSIDDEKKSRWSLDQNIFLNTQNKMKKSIFQN